MLQITPIFLFDLEGISNIKIRFLVYYLSVLYWISPLQKVEILRDILLLNTSAPKFVPISFQVR